MNSSCCFSLGELLNSLEDVVNNNRIHSFRKIIMTDFFALVKA